jgi:hypothetical protein
MRYPLGPMPHDPSFTNTLPQTAPAQPRDRQWLTAQTERAITFFNARKAIREGRDPEGVKAKLRAAGFDFSESDLEL